MPLNGSSSPGVDNSSKVKQNRTVSCEPRPCPTSCENIFDMVHVSYLMRGGTRVMWQLLNTFNDPQPWLFQLQTGQTGNPLADDWQDVGIAVENTCYAIDPQQRDFNKTLNTHYRVKLITPNQTYFSDPTAQTGILNVRDWRLAREIVRKEKLRANFTSQDGYLLKRRLTGANCTRCLDLQTMEVKDPYCPQCWGTGKQCGYYYPMACIWVDMAPSASKLNMDDQAVRGTIQDVRIKARMLMLPLIGEQDIWVSRKTDTRYYIESIQDIAEIRAVPLIAQVDLRPAPFTDVAYRIPIPQQDDWLRERC
jgi:hypothetical protein